MTTKNHSGDAASEREIVSQRIIAAPREVLFQAFSEPERLRFKVNQVEMRFDVVSAGRVTVRLRNSGWDFDHYEITANGKSIEQKNDDLAWALQPGANEI